MESRLDIRQELMEFVLQAVHEISGIPLDKIKTDRRLVKHLKLS